MSSTERAPQEMRPVNPRSKSSTKVRLVQAAALAAVLVPLGSVAMEASSITCGFGGGSANFCAGSGGNTRVFDFRPLGSGYKVVLEFENLHGQIDVTMTDVFTNQSALSSGGRLDNFPNHTCVTIHEFTDCVDFHVTAPGPSSSTWTGFFNLFIYWDADTNALFPNGTGQIRMLHNLGSTSGNDFDTDITIPGSYFAGSPDVADPGIGGRDNNFQSFIVTHAPIPEPATLLLVGSGVGALLYNRRRRRRDPDGPARL
jgi:hypothetical protein